MRCRKHPTDHSSSVGVCASCLRERLLVALLAAQAQARQAIEDSLKSDTQSPPQAFPRSVSPYVSRRKSDMADWPLPHQQSQLNHGLTDQRFHCTPQVGHNGNIVVAASSVRRRKDVKFSFLSSLFRSKSDKTGLDAGVTLSEPDCRESFPASSSSPSWLPNVLAGRRQKQLRTFFTDESRAGRPRIKHRDRDRGMSPARCDDEECCHGSSGYSSESSQQGCNQTPSRAALPSRRRGGGRRSYSRNVAGLAFCLSPLVRASPNQHWNQKTMPPETVIAGEIRVQAKPHLSSAASYCANRSRKLADFGRFNQTY